MYKQPTHRRAEQNPTTIDLVFSNEESMVNNLKTVAPLGKSHHCCILFEIVCYADKRPNGVKKPVYNKGDYDNLNREIKAYDWKEDLEGKTCEQAWSMFDYRIKKGIEKNVPLKSYKGNKSGSLWMNENALNKIKSKNRAYKEYLNKRDEVSYKLYARARNQAKRECKKAQMDYEKSIAEEVKSNSKAFFKYANSKLKTRSGIGNLETQNGKACTDLEKSEALNEFFASVFIREDTSSVPEFTLDKEIKSPLNNLIVTEEMVKSKLARLNPIKSPGPDAIHPRVLRELNNSISKPLSIIMNI